jgi:hypothetical protein
MTEEEIDKVARAIWMAAPDDVAYAEAGWPHVLIDGHLNINDLARSAIAALDQHREGKEEQDEPRHRPSAIYPPGPAMLAAMKDAERIWREREALASPKEEER